MFLDVWRCRTKVSVWRRIIIAKGYSMAQFTSTVLNDCFGLTGGIATGKSTVAGMLAKLGCRIVDTDLIARKVVEPGQPALQEIVREFGEAALKQDGTLDREYIRSIIIAEPQKREALNSITHPRIGLEVLRQVDLHRSDESGMPIIVDVPLLFEAGWHSLFPAVILVYVPVAVQIERLMARDKLSREKAEKTLSFQMGIEEKKHLATYIIDNSGTLEKTHAQVVTLFEKLKMQK
jgi:dephospho-CoA kinase